MVVSTPTGELTGESARFYLEQVGYGGPTRLHDPAAKAAFIRAMTAVPQTMGYGSETDEDPFYTDPAEREDWPADFLTTAA
jgi:hypothetical protein